MGHSWPCYGTHLVLLWDTTLVHLWNKLVCLIWDRSKNPPYQYCSTLNVNISYYGTPLVQLWNDYPKCKYSRAKEKRPECYYQRISHKYNLFNVYFLDFLFCFLFSLANSFFLESSAFFIYFSFLLVSFSKNFCCLLFSSSFLFCSTALCLIIASTHVYIP